MTTRHGDGASSACREASPLEDLAACLTRAPSSEIDVRGVCHDLRQSVATIRAIAELMVADSAAPATWRARASAIAQEASYAGELCQTMVVPTPSIPACDLAEAARSAARAASVRNKGKVTQLLLLNDAQALIDRLSAWRIASNLVDNACRAAGPHGTVVIATYVRDGDACLRVEDDAANGCYPAGTGVGLSVVQSALRAVRGRLRLEHSTLGGTRASVFIPTASPHWSEELDAGEPELPQPCAS